MLQLHGDNPNNPLDGDVQAPFNKPMTFMADIQEDAAYPVTVTWTIDGSGVSQVGDEVMVTIGTRVFMPMVIK